MCSSFFLFVSFSLCGGVSNFFDFLFSLVVVKTEGEGQSVIRELVAGKEAREPTLCRPLFNNVFVRVAHRIHLFIVYPVGFSFVFITFCCCCCRHSIKFHLSLCCNQFLFFQVLSQRVFRALSILADRRCACIASTRFLPFFFLLFLVWLVVSFVTKTPKTNKNTKNILFFLPPACAMDID